MARKKNKRNKTTVNPQPRQRPGAAATVQTAPVRYTSPLAVPRYTVRSPLRLTARTLSPSVTRPQSRAPIKVPAISLVAALPKLNMFAPKKLAPARKAEPLKTRLTGTVKLGGVTKTPNITKKEHALHSSLTRDTKNCKARPEGHHPKRAGGSAAKSFVPWCNRR